MVSHAPHRPKVLMQGEGEQFPLLSHTVTVKVSSDDTNGEWSVFEIVDTEGNGAPLHSHPWDETFYILEGELEIRMGNRTISAPRGAVTHIPANTPHGFRIASSKAQALIMISPGTAEAFYRDMGEATATLPPDMERIQEVCQRHGLKLFEQPKL